MVVGAGSAHAGNGVTLTLAKQVDGPYSDEIRRNVPTGEKKNVYIRVKNLGGATSSVQLFSPADDPPGYTFKYFRLNGDNVTADVTSGGGLSFNVKAGKAKKFRMVIKALDDQDQDCIFPNIIYTGGNDDDALLAINTPISSCQM
jgi:hypothetical protein